MAKRLTSASIRTLASSRLLRKRYTVVVASLISTYSGQVLRELFLEFLTINCNQQKRDRHK